MTAAQLVAEHGSPLWLADLDRVAANWSAFGAAWRAAWDDVEVAYSYKTNRLPAILRAVDAAGAAPEVVCEAELLLALAVTGAPGSRIIVNGPAKPESFLRRAAHAGALVVADSTAELDRAAAAGVQRVGVRVALRGVGVEPTRFGVPAHAVPAAVARARGLGLEVESLAAHLVSTGFDQPLAQVSRLGEAIAVHWPRPAAEHADAAALLGALAVRLGIGTVDLGGGFPPAPAVGEQAAAVAGALRDARFDGRLVLEPGRAIVADAVDLACSVVAVKRLDDGRRCVVVDAGTNLIAGALWAWPRVEAEGGADRDDRALEPALVTGPLCLNVDVLHPAANLPALAVGDVLLVRAVGAYHQAQSTQFGDLRPATVALEDGRWTLCHRRETLDDLLAGDLGADVLRTFAGGRTEEVQA